MTDTNTGTTALTWKGDFTPQIGEEIRANLNNLGTGRVTGYFAEEGFLGVTVELDAPPAWFTRQNGGSKTAHLFGLEIAPMNEATQ